MLTTRTARLEDLSTLLKFEQGVVEAERPFGPTYQDKKITYYDLEYLINDNSSCLLLAEIDGKIVGSGYAKLMHSKPFERHKQHAYLGFMYITPEHRGQGINKIVLDRLIDWAVQQGIDEIRLDVFAENSPAINAYQKAGFEPYLVEMRRSC